MEQITKREIFEKMSARFGVPNRMPMARAARFLHENGYTPNALHYARMLDLLRDLDEFLTIERQEGERDYTVILHGFSLEEICPAQENEKRKIDEKEKDFLRAMVRKNTAESVFPAAQLSRWMQKEGRNCRQYGVSRMRTLIEKLPDVFAVCRDDGKGDILLSLREKELSPEEKEENRMRLYDFLYLPPRQMEVLSALINGGEGTRDVWQMLADALALSRREQKPEPQGETFLWEPEIETWDGNGVRLKLEKSGDLSLPPWMLVHCEKREKFLPKNVRALAFLPQKQLYTLEKWVNEGRKQPLDVMQGLIDSYETVRKSGDWPWEAEEVRLPFPLSSPLGERITLVLKRNRVPQKQPYVLSRMEKKNGPSPVPKETPWPETWEEFASLPAASAAALQHLLDREGGNVPRAADFLRKIYGERRSALKKERNRVFLPLPLKNEDGEPVTAVFVPNRQMDGPLWLLHFVGSLKNPEDSLEKWAYMGKWQKNLGQLAAMAAPEPWDFSGSGQQNYVILREYLLHTFSRLYREGKVRESPREACFHTGLKTEQGTDLFAFFVPAAPNPYGTRWTFSSFSPWEQARKKGIWEGEPPEKADYGQEEMPPYDPRGVIAPEYAHILVDNITRLPCEFLARCWEQDDAVRKLWQETADFPRGSAAFRAQLRKIGGYLQKNPPLFREVCRRFDRAVQKTVSLLRDNPRWAVPTYYPTRQVMEWLVPLSLGGNGVDMALLLEKTENGYTAPTVLTLPMAYMNTRLLGRMEDSWLTVDAVRVFLQREKAPDKEEIPC